MVCGCVCAAHRPTAARVHACQLSPLNASPGTSTSNWPVRRMRSARRPGRRAGWPTRRSHRFAGLSLEVHERDRHLQHGAGRDPGAADRSVPDRVARPARLDLQALPPRRAGTSARTRDPPPAGPTSRRLAVEADEQADALEAELHSVRARRRSVWCMAPLAHRDLEGAGAQPFEVAGLLAVDGRREPRRGRLIRLDRRAASRCC